MSFPLCWERFPKYTFSMIFLVESSDFSFLDRVYQANKKSEPPATHQFFAKARSIMWLCHGPLKINVLMIECRRENNSKSSPRLATPKESNTNEIKKKQLILPLAALDSCLSSHQLWDQSFCSCFRLTVACFGGPYALTREGDRYQEKRTGHV